MEIQSDGPGHWVCHKTLGTGSYGVVELWQNDQTKAMIAIKKYIGHSNHLTEKRIARWENEIRTMGSVKHPNVVATLPVPEQFVVSQGALPFLCMEYCSRGDLRKVLNQSSNSCGIKEEEALRIMNDVASGVEYLHSRNLTHRDLKPENIVLQDTGRKIVYKLTDLGYVRELGEMSADASVVGTLNYLAPELLWKKTYTRSVDYWSLGVLFYEIVTGARPFLPHMPITATWINHVKSKKHEDICAREEDGNVIFDTEIETPTTLSECVRIPLTAWFRLALEWYPWKRGTTTNDAGVLELSIFSRLRPITSSKILYVHVASEYRIDSYAVSAETTVHELQNLIRDKTGISLNDQILTDSKSNVLHDRDSPIVRCTEESHLAVFRKNCYTFEVLSKPNLSRPIRRMFSHPQESLDHETLKRHYSAAVFFVSQELDLFSSHLIALGVQIDLSNMALVDTRQIIDALTINANNLLADLTSFEGSADSALMGEESRKLLVITKSKTQQLVKGTERASAQLNTLTKENESLMRRFMDSNLLDKWKTLHEKATGLLNAAGKKNRSKKYIPVEMVKVLYEALRLRDEAPKSPEISSIMSEISVVDQSITNLQGSLKSFKILIDTHRNNYAEIVTNHELANQNSFLELANLSTPTSAVIFDNIMLRSLIDAAIGHGKSEDMDISDG